MMWFARSSTVAVMLAAAMAAAGCGSDSDDSATSSPAGATTTPAATTPAATTTPPAAADATDDATDDADVSAAGETLALGKRAVVPYVVYGSGSKTTQQETTLGVTVLRVRKGKISDFKDFNLDKEQKNTVPYYVDVKYENLGDLKLQRFLLDPSVEDTDGQEYKPLNLIVLSGTFKKCPQPSRARLRGGQSFTLCAPVLLPKGKTYERVRFQGDVTKDPYFWK